ncbi:hypothetical protein B0H19DRAFT_1249460 [Mycena capillaripes]|nr:hypothetical protein B0H19DRAFT_1249460 [Mycena capillaripes]
MPEELSPYEYQFHKKPSDAAAVSLYNHLISLRDLAISAPLEQGMQFMLDLQIPPQNPHLGARQVPKTFITDRSNFATVALQLNTALQSGFDRFSQVWTATVVGVPETCLVMKVIQPSLCFLPDPSNMHWREAYYDPLDLAPTRLGCIESSRTDRIDTPALEAAWILLEFIPGPTIHDVAKSMSTDAVHDFCTLGLDAVRDLTLSGWTLGDIRCANFILTGSPEHVIPPPTLECLAVVDAKRFFDAFQNCVGTTTPAFTTGLGKTCPSSYGITTTTLVSPIPKTIRSQTAYYALQEC